MFLGPFPYMLSCLSRGTLFHELDIAFLAFALPTYFELLEIGAQAVVRWKDLILGANYDDVMNLRVP